MYFQWQDLNTTLTRPDDRLWHLIAQRTLIGSPYTGNIEKCYNSIHVFRRKVLNVISVYFKTGNSEMVSVIIVRQGSQDLTDALCKQDFEYTL